MQHDKQLIFCGVDPGFTAPCMCILGEAQEPLAVHFIDGSKYKTWDDYSRAFQIGQLMSDFVNKNWPKAKVILGIEGPSYGSSQRSASMEQMALCRQAIYDAFSVFTDLEDWHQIAPSTAKKTITGNGRADKETVIAFARVIAPKTMTDHPTFRQVKRRTGKVEQVLNSKTAAMADSIAIAMAAKRKWEKK